MKPAGISQRLAQYINRWAEHETRLFLNAYLSKSAHQLPSPFNQSYDYVITVPVYNEPQHWWHQLTRSLRDQSICWIWVYNCPESLSQAQINPLHQQMMHCLSQITHRHDSPPFFTGRLSPNQMVIVVDRLSQPIPDTSGVGLARKIAADLALALCWRGCIRHPWIFNTDADASLPQTYLSHPKLIIELNNKDCSAIQLGFVHKAQTPQWAEAAWCYDQYLRYHYRGLDFAHSPYAFTTIGSLMVISMSHYAIVRGFPKRAAAEDFYLLNKLRKVGTVAMLDEPVVTLQGRPSDRVPFGTGPALRAWQTLNRDNILTYHPQCYQALKTLLEQIEAYLHQSQLIEKRTSNTSHTLPPPLGHALEQLGWEKWFQSSQIRSHQDPEFRQTAFNNWFDGLKTWQFIKKMSTQYPLITIREAACTLIAQSCNSHDHTGAGT